MTIRPVRGTLVALTLAAALATTAACNDDKAPVDDDKNATSTTKPSNDPETDPVTPEEKDDPESTEAAIARYEEFLHATGNEDVDTMCEIAGPAAEQAEDEGFGACEQTMPITLSMISDEQKAALRDATVDPSKVTEQSDGTLSLPATCVVADVTFTDSDLGDAVMEYRTDAWYVID